jgi:FkbM family methyltransferase
MLSRNLKLNNLTDRVVVESSALSDQNGTHQFFSRNDQMSSLVRSGLGTNADSEDIITNEVTTFRLDDYLKEKGQTAAQWVKLDTEGAEINILRGAEKFLQSEATIVCELHPYAWPEFKTSYDELLSIVRDCNKQISYLEPSLKIEDGPVHGAVIIS